MKIGSPDNIILFDGVCNLCSGTVAFLIKIDKMQKLYFSPLQSEYSEKILGNKQLTKITDPDTVVFINKSRHYYQSDAILQVFGIMSFPWKLMYYFRFLPKKFRDFVYNFIASNRYNWFGRKDACMMPSQELKNRFL